MLYDLHTHTVFSHGKGTPRQNIEAAIKKGLTQIGITDHASGHTMYCVRDMEGYLSECGELKREYAGRIDVRIGLEFNLTGVNGESDLTADIADKLDICLLGFHKMASMRDVSSMLYLCFTDKSDIARNTDAYLKQIYTGRFDIITHPNYGLKLDMRRFAKACAETGTLIEINGKHPEFTPDELKEAAAEGAGFILSSDAHSPERVGEVPDAVRKAAEAGILPQVVNWDGAK